MALLKGYDDVNENLERFVDCFFCCTLYLVSTYLMQCNIVLERCDLPAFAEHTCIGGNNYGCNVYC
jgi:hypothetical protein